MAGPRGEAPQLDTPAGDQGDQEGDGAGRTEGDAAAKHSIMNRQDPDGLMSSSQSLFWSGSVPRPPSGPAGPAVVQSSAKETFSSSFSFIQQSLNSSETPPSPEPEPMIHKKGANSAKSECPVLLPPSASWGGPTEGEDLPSCRRCPWDGRGDPPDPPDCDTVDMELFSSFSVDSDNASASSVTSGYESATPTSEQGWDHLVRRYEGVLQECLQNNRTYSKVGTTTLILTP